MTIEFEGLPLPHHIETGSGTQNSSPSQGVVGGGPNAVIAATDNPEAPAVSGANTGNGAVGYIAGTNAPFGTQPVGVMGRSDVTGVIGLSNAPAGAGVYGGSLGGAGTGVFGESTTGSALRGKSNGPGLAGEFLGNVRVTGQHAVNGDVTVGGSLSVTGDVFLVSGGDLSERFPLSAGAAPALAPGTVVSIGDDGGLAATMTAYDPRVVGVVAGGSARPTAITLRDEIRTAPNAPVALTGTVCCLAEADTAPIRVGDLLTSSAVAGHAMRAEDAWKGHGSVIGKALQTLDRGRGTVLMLVQRH